MTNEITATVPQAAAEKGMTRHVLVSNGEYDIEGYISPDADLDGVFTMYDSQEREFLRVKGWMAEIEDYTDIA